MGTDAADTGAAAPAWARAWMCVTFTRGLGPDEVLARYGADPDRARPLDRDAASELLPDDADGGPVSLLRTGRIGEWAFCVEEEGTLGFGQEALAGLSRGSETYSVATTEGIDVFQYWRDGECVVEQIQTPPPSRPSLGHGQRSLPRGEQNRVRHPGRMSAGRERARHRGGMGRSLVGPPHVAVRDVQTVDHHSRQSGSGV
ncbi:DUF6461 domain-containing protein [Streptomyces pseudogriseolus]|uniref:DUF6461 domain-containing protein n=1 Tax=Streptomyces pseudogriseolus TaxID=36817 RepID=UPI003FA29968